MNFTKYVKVRQEKFGAVIFETLKEKVFITNKIGAEILDLIAKGKSLNEIIDILKNEYNEDETLISKDVTDFIAELKKNGILEDQ